MKWVLLSLLPAIALRSYCQSTSEELYFNKDLKEVKKNHAEFKGIKTKKDSVYELQLFNKEGNYHIFTAHYSDEKLEVMNGWFASFYRNGYIETQSNFHNGKLQGFFIRWTDDHRIVDSVWYEKGDSVYSIAYKYNDLSKKLESIVRTNYKDSSSTRIRFDEAGRMIPPDISDSTSKADDSIYAKVDEPAEFPGGDSMMLKYFTYMLNRTRASMLLSGSAGLCQLQLVIDKNGNVVNAVSIACDNNVYASAAKFAAFESTWLPATANGRPVKAYKNIVVSYYPSIPAKADEKRGQYFFDVDMNPVSEDKAIYYGKITPEDNTVRFDVFKKISKQHLFCEHYTDSTLEASNGLFYANYPDGNLRVKGNFLLGRKDGVWAWWNDDQRVTDSVFYKIGELRSVTTFTYEPDGSLFETNTWTPETGEVHYRVFNNNDVTNDTTFDLMESVQNISDSTFVPATFSGGVKGWYSYMSEYFKHHDRNVYVDGICTVKFMIDTTGKVTNVVALNMQGTSLANYAIKMIRRSPNWLPAIKNGIKVNSYKYQKVSFGIYKTYIPFLNAQPRSRFGF